MNYLKHTILILCCLIFCGNSLYSQIKLYPLEKITPAEAGTDAANLYWTEDGNETSMFEKAGDRTIVLSFWGTWCGFCVRHTPDLEKAYQNLPKEKYYFINAVGEYTKESESALRTAIETNNVTFDNVWYTFDDEDSMQAHAFYGVSEFITTLVITTDRKVRFDIKDVLYKGLIDSLDQITSVEISDDGDKAMVAAYPNPFSDILVFKYNAGNDDEAIIELFDQLGNVVSTNRENVSSGKENTSIIETTGLNSGIYYYRINTGKEFYSGRVILSR